MTVYGQLFASAGRPVEAQEIFGRQLRLCREDRGLMLVAAADHINASTAKLSRIEGGKIRISEEDLDQLLTLYGVTEAAERHALFKFCARLRKGQWWDRHTAVLGSSFCSFLVLESIAERIFTYETLYIPGPLQTPAYAEAVIGLHDAPAEDIRRRIEVRIQRQRVLFEPGAPHLWAVIGEAALHDALSDDAVTPQIMQEQIRYLIEIATRLPKVTIQILPSTKRWRLPAESPFSLLRLPWRRLCDVAYLEHLGDAFFLDSSERADLFLKLRGQLVINAQEPAKSVATLKQRLADLDGSRRQP